MRRLRLAGTAPRWAVLLGVLLAVGPLVQASTPCRGAMAPDDAASGAVVTVMASGAQWTCSETAAAPVVRAVSTERSTVSLDGPSGDTLLASVSTGSPAFFLDEQRRAPPLPASSALDALRPVVLQI